MVTVINAYTEEIDEVEEAAAELLAQIKVSSLKKNSCGIVICYYEYIDVGLIAALKEKLPFDIVGCTTMAVSVNDRYSQYGLCLTVFTSDDASFSSAMAVVAEDAGDREKIQAAYEAALAAAGGKPDLIIPFLPMTLKASSSSYLSLLDEISGGVPMFGSTACDYTMTHEHAAVFRNGASERNGLALLFMRGVSPEFNIVSMPDRNMQLRKATVTKASGCIIYEANGMSFRDYVTSLGIEKIDDPNMLATIPLSLNYGDGKPVTVAIFKMHNDGSVFCGSEIPQGITFSMGSMDYASIIETAKEIMEWAKGDRPVLFFSCVGRFLLLSPNNDDEMQAFVEQWEAGKRTPHMLAYSGGEICPVPGKDGKLHNRYHNFTVTGCKF